MEINKAKSIIQDIVCFVFYSEGIQSSIDDETLERLREYELEDMAKAQRIVAESNGSKILDENGVKEIHMQMNVDPRLIAALYVLFHYKSDDASDADCIIGDGRKGVFCVH